MISLSTVFFLEIPIETNVTFEADGQTKTQKTARRSGGIVPKRGLSIHNDDVMMERAVPWITEC